MATEPCKRVESFGTGASVVFVTLVNAALWVKDMSFPCVAHVPARGCTTHHSLSQASVGTLDGENTSLMSCIALLVTCVGSVSMEEGRGERGKMRRLERSRNGGGEENEGTEGGGVRGSPRGHGWERFGPDDGSVFPWRLWTLVVRARINPWV